MKRSTLSLMLYTAQTLLEQANTQSDNGNDQAADDTLAALGKVLRFEPEEDQDEREPLRLCRVPDCDGLASRGGYCDAHDHKNEDGARARCDYELPDGSRCALGAIHGGRCAHHWNADIDAPPKPKRVRKPRAPKAPPAPAQMLPGFRPAGDDQ